MRDTLTDDTILKWLALATWPGLGPKTWRELDDHLGSAIRIFDDPELPDTLPVSLQRKLWKFGKSGNVMARAKREFDRCRRLKIGIICRDHPEYPPLLSQIHDPPPVLFFRGQTDFLDELRYPSLAVVGTRNPTEYGKSVTREFTAQLADRFCIVSGLAIGIDAIAHSAALDADGSTIAVLGCGLDQDYPASNRALRDRIESRGLVLSEFPPGTQPNPSFFPRRNRIISGLSLGVLVMEARLRSGALITANLALDQGREVMAIPGPIHAPASRGPLSLIQLGAYPVLTPDDVISQIPLNRPGSAAPGPSRRQPGLPPADLDDAHMAVWRVLGPEQIMIDDIIVQSGLSAQTVQNVLMEFELSGWIRQLPGKYFMLTD